MAKRSAGFSLIELMVTVAIIGILAGIAYPSYTDSVRKSRRAEAIIALNSIALLQERWRANNTTYGVLAPCAVAAAGCFRIQGAAVTGTITTENGLYTLDTTVNSATAFTARAAAPSGSNQASDRASGTSCQTLQLNQNGPLFSPAGQNACWNKN